MDIWGTPSREPVPAKKKKEVRERAKGKCESCRKKPRGVTLQFHHKNMKPTDNRLSNIQLLCPNCHARKHKMFKKVKTESWLGEERVRIKRVGKKPGRKSKYRRKKVGETLLGDPIYRRVKVKPTKKRKTAKKKTKRRKRRDSWEWF